MSDRTNVGRLLSKLRAADAPRLVLPGAPPSSVPASVALLSSSFDPMTIGHAALAEAARALVDLVVLTYSVRTMPKEPGAPGPWLSEIDRLAAVEAFCRSRPGLALGLCSHGLLVEQIAAARASFPRARPWLVMGSDKLLQLFDPRWYDDPEDALDRLFADAEVLYAVRAGDGPSVAELFERPAVARRRDRIHALRVSAEVAALSSRWVRERHGRGEDVRHLVPPEVSTILPARA